MDDSIESYDELESNKEIIDTVFSILTPSEREFISRRYGFDRDKGLSFIKMARDLGVSGETVRQEDLKILRKIRSDDKILSYIIPSYDSDMLVKLRKLCNKRLFVYIAYMAGLIGGKKLNSNEICKELAINRRELKKLSKAAENILSLDRDYEFLYEKFRSNLESSISSKSSSNVEPVTNDNDEGFGYDRMSEERKKEIQNYFIEDSKGNLQYEVLILQDIISSSWENNSTVFKVLKKCNRRKF